MYIEGDKDFEKIERLQEVADQEFAYAEFPPDFVLFPLFQLSFFAFISQTKMFRGFQGIFWLVPKLCNGISSTLFQLILYLRLGPLKPCKAKVAQR